MKNTRMNVVSLAFAVATFASMSAFGDLTLEALKAVKSPPPADSRYSVEVHIVTTGICTFSRRPWTITVPFHDEVGGPLQTHYPYLMVDENNFSSANPASEVEAKTPNDNFSTLTHYVYYMSGDELTLSADMAANVPLTESSEDGEICPTGRNDVAMHWVPSLSDVLGEPAKIDYDYFVKNPDSDLVAGRVILSDNGGALHAHVVDARVYEYESIGFGHPNHVQAVAQLVDYTFRINGNLTIRRRKFVSPGQPSNSAEDFIVLKPYNGEIFVKIGNTPELFLDPHTSPSKVPMDEDFLLHYDMIDNPGQSPVPTAIGICGHFTVLTCGDSTHPHSCTASGPGFDAPEERPAVFDTLQILLDRFRLAPFRHGGHSVTPSKKRGPVLSVGGLDCGPDGLP